MTTARLQNIKLLLLDVDGVLTDGSLAYTNGQVETKVFHVRDGLGIKMLHQGGIKTGIVTGRSSAALIRRCRELGVDMFFDGIRDKAEVLDQIISDTGYNTDEIAFMGDDLPDLPLLKKIGLAIAVADAHELVCQQADIVTQTVGGRGAVREVCEMLLKSQGIWQKLMGQWI
ncbi:MAG: HAD hydrolase family protein [Desulfobacterales bacterium]|nr:HAD hydrolase family protein [Desulfobacterales bacterium]